MKSEHVTVLLDEAVDALNIKAGGNYVDATFGRGGHSRRILQKLENGKLLVVDRDPEAILVAKQLSQEDERVVVEYGAFEMLGALIDKNFETGVDGILFDLGISSPQIDVATRGFSFMQDGPLDMRMDNSQGESAADWLNHADWKEMSKVFWRYGEEKNATAIAKEIVLYRENEKPIENTAELVSIVVQVNKKQQNKHPATRVFQAIRIHINRELEQIKNVLPEAVEKLCSGGRLVVISFHSLEDRIVKNFIKEKMKPVAFDKRLPIAPDWKSDIKTIGKPVKPSENEVKNNPRARSSIMRVIEKV
ncbi:MAG TPA: 16S rRNA (cytosine(1402)-N(4))-methyltransferase RsmH [Gammaproteobacteria bacterium]|nr:16S rRNA (cytosine(1402)-N(4))-methyltransferase RsmH [Xanthomonadales bacterium]MCB1594368.1 16S rRNA (cytosine(1402)-N(4))-methyltransferase RsmH [Xanthomonadales bacterium]HOP22603.1 16S rRNA (cytosine(1402)-N(4))-methyltransferase RsmH [Gammaproteobacteria bacterium]HPI95307.1 16S rRNA (cytosine(1402)-N(4))-methyltransferase RsmH [Gammaproteobacteria bacterium]HPQ87281.1 16S rRNA (cytosine(1402)-N(4))-methyltransferase RsmH [Gammaproteobacteria bacterium]